MVRLITVYQDEEFQARTGGADMSGFHIGKFFCPSEKFARRSGHVIEISHHTGGIAHQVLQLTAPFHPPTGNEQGEVLFACSRMLFVAGGNIGSHVFYFLLIPAADYGVDIQAECGRHVSGRVECLRKQGAFNVLFVFIFHLNTIL